MIGLKEYIDFQRKDSPGYQPMANASIVTEENPAAGNGPIVIVTVQNYLFPNPQQKLSLFSKY